jgi:integrase
MFDPKTRSYRGAQLHGFRRTAASNMNAKGIQEGKAMTVTGHKTNSMYKRYGIEELDSAARRARCSDGVIELKRWPGSVIG